MFEGNLAFIQNRAHGTSSRYKLATTSHHGQGFSIGKLATVSFTSSISVCVYARRKASSRYLFLDPFPCAYFKIEHMAQAQSIS